jgi:signal transduction histidine kinase
VATVSSAPAAPDDLIAFAIAHEVRNLLTPARAHLELGGRDASVAAIGAIDRVLEFADAVLRAKPGAMCDVREAVDGALNGMNLRQTRVDVEVEHGTRAMIAGPILERVVANLVLNAVQAMRGQGEVILRCFTWNGGLRVQITDTGPGIPQAARCPSRGRGLQICMFLVEQSGGRLILDQRPGQGTTVTIDLSSEEAQKKAA